MKNKSIHIILICVLVVSFVLGVTGSVVFAEEAESVDSAGRDRLIGVFITTEHLDLFDFESYFNENADKILSGGEISLSDSESYQGKLYASLVDDPYTNPVTGETTITKKYMFEDAKGICFFIARYSDEQIIFWGSSGDDAISDGHTGIESTAAGDSIDLSGTIFVSVSKGSDTFYCNPVYQTPDGKVYTTTGNGMCYGGEIVAGMGSSYSLKDEQTVTVDDKNETISTNVEISVSYMETPIAANILQFDKNGSIVSAQEYVCGELPASITAESDTDYMIVETYMLSSDGTETVSRALFQSEDESLFTYTCREDGICVKQYCNIAWDKNS